MLWFVSKLSIFFLVHTTYVCRYMYSSVLSYTIQQVWIYWYTVVNILVGKKLILTRFCWGSIYESLMKNNRATVHLLFIIYHSNYNQMNKWQNVRTLCESQMLVCSETLKKDVTVWCFIVYIEMNQWDIISVLKERQSLLGSAG